MTYGGSGLRSLGGNICDLGGKGQGHQVGSLGGDT